jgi:TRAP transporter TAXI family solute receptor
MNGLRIRTLGTIIIVAVFLSAGMSDLQAQPQKRLSIATASTAGTWYPLGGAIANVISKNVKNTEAMAYPSGASIENIRSLRKGQTDLAMIQPDVAFWAYTGTGQFAKDKPYQGLRAIMAMYPIFEQIVVPYDSPIKSVSDMKGKKIGVGPPGSGTEVLNRLLLAEYGVTYKDCDPKFLSAPEQVEALKDGNIDAIMLSLGAPAPGFMDLQSQRKIRFIEIEPKMLKQVNKKYPYYVTDEITVGTYKDQTKPIPVIAWMGLICVSADMNDQLVYDILKAFWDNKAVIDKVHVTYKEITLKNAPIVPIPLHNGAIKFYKEKGVLK